MITSTRELERLWEQHDGRCAYGGRLLVWEDYGIESPTGWVVDLAVPAAWGGPDTFENYRVACWACARLKASMTAAEWLQRLGIYYKDRCPEWYLGAPITHGL